MRTKFFLLFVRVLKSRYTHTECDNLMAKTTKCLCDNVMSLVGAAGNGGNNFPHKPPLVYYFGLRTPC